ncbi:outer membrane beta-barrel protein [Ancylomarina sp. DW003]|nr:OmpW family outer membrane protein [Ancylomarina sp. DW003]MDE5423453.1 outer membrane beta-barrel protein [Ancylomarina sp. DW003]
MRTLFLIFFALLFTSSLSAQYSNKDDRFIVGLNAGVVNPMGDFADESKLGTEISLNAKMLLNPKLAVGLSVGYMDFAQNDDLWAGDSRVKNDVNYQIIPIVLTGTYFIQAYDLDFRPYASLGFGYFLYRNHVESIPTNTYTPVKSEYTVSTGKVGLIPNVGFMYNLSKKLAVDVNLKLTYIPNFDEKLEKKKIKPRLEEGAELSDLQKYRYLGFDKITSASLTVGMYYRF